MKKVWNFLKKLVFWTFFISLFFVTVITVVLHVYKDDIEQFAIAELNEYLTTNVEVRNIELSIFHDFPNASLKFEHVFAADAFKEMQSNDTLLYADELFFHFNLLDIWSGDYKVKRGSIHRGQINLKTTKTGDVNYEIAKPSEDSLKDSNFSFLFELLKVEDVDFAYINRFTNQSYELTLNDALLRGDFAATKYDLAAEGDLHIKRLKSGSFTLISNKDAQLNLQMDIDTDAKRYVFKTGDLAVEKMKFNMTGAIDSSTIDLSLVGKKIQIAALANSLASRNNDPDNPSGNVSGNQLYNGEGLFNFTATVNGGLGKTIMPAIDANFEVMDGSIIEPENQLKIYAINIAGRYQNQQTDREEELDFKSFSFKMLNSNFTGSGQMRNFSQPTFRTKAKGNLDLAAFNQFFKFKNVDELSGNVKLDLSCVIQFFDPEYRKDKFQFSESYGSIDLSKVVFKSTESHLRFADISGNILVNGKDAAAKNLTIKTAKSDLTLNGAMKNFIPYLEGRGSLGLIASLESTQIDLNEFLGPSNSEKKGDLTMFELPNDLNVNLELDLKKFNWENHAFKNITGQFLLANRKATVNGFKLSTLNGVVSGLLSLTNRLEQGNVINGKMNFSNIDIKALFAEWKNFDQKSITSEHISGKVNGAVDLLLLFNPYFSLIEDKIYLKAAIEMSNGALVNLETMQAITDYMRSNKALKLMLNKHIDQFEEKLMNLKFSKLSNEIEIENRRINIPKMTIKTNALDVDLFGWHDFDNNIEYHFSFRFRQLKTKPEYTEFGKVEDDGLGIIIYMTMSGTIDDPVFSLDKDARKNDVKANIEAEKTNMKSILKTEFGMFKKDSTIQERSVDNKKEVEFIYYDTDIEDTDTTKNEKKNKKRVGKFFDKLKEDAEKDKNDVDFERER